MILWEFCECLWNRGVVVIALSTEKHKKRQFLANPPASPDKKQCPPPPQLSAPDQLQPLFNLLSLAAQPLASEIYV